jgi:hypothetical protein
VNEDEATRNMWLSFQNLFLWSIQQLWWWEKGLPEMDLTLGRFTQAGFCEQVGGGMGWSLGPLWTETNHRRDCPRASQRQPTFPTMGYWVRSPYKLLHYWKYQVHEGLRVWGMIWLLKKKEKKKHQKLSVIWKLCILVPKLLIKSNF